jgi:uncharacterized protein with HEPN domain
MRDVRARLADIIEAIEQIESQASKGKSAFLADSLIQVWMVHHLMIIGEAVRAIDPAFKQKHPGVPWRQIAGMRNVLVHDYFRVNQTLVWETIEKDIPALKTEILRIYRELPPPTTE